MLPTSPGGFRHKSVLSTVLFKNVKYLFCVNEGEDKQVMQFLIKEQNRDIRMLKKIDSCSYLQIK